MTDNREVSELISSLHLYLQELEETGIDGLSLEEEQPSSLLLVAEETLCYETISAEEETLEDIKTHTITCDKCSLVKTRTNLVFGTGTSQARLVLVGEAPGRDEDLQGEPFVGEAGQLLTKIINAMGLSRQDVYICNVLKCRPPGNRNPLPEEIEVCMPYLIRQLDVIKPQVIVALGTFAAQTLLQTKEPISKLRGLFHDYRGIALMPTFHPAFLLRNPAMKREVWEDMKQVMKRLGIEVPQKGTEQR